MSVGRWRTQQAVGSVAKKNETSKVDELTERAEKRIRAKRAYKPHGKLRASNKNEALKSDLSYRVKIKSAKQLSKSIKNKKNSIGSRGAGKKWIGEPLVRRMKTNGNGAQKVRGVQS